MKVIGQPHALAALPRTESWPVSFNRRQRVLHSRYESCVKEKKNPFLSRIELRFPGRQTDYKVSCCSRMADPLCVPPLISKLDTNSR